MYISSWKTRSFSMQNGIYRSQKKHAPWRCHIGPSRNGLWSFKQTSEGSFSAGSRPFFCNWTLTLSHFPTFWVSTVFNLPKGPQKFNRTSPKQLACFFQIVLKCLQICANTVIGRTDFDEMCRNFMTIWELWNWASLNFWEFSKSGGYGWRPRGCPNDFLRIYRFS